jgi:outer membrane protein TolC|tara:strand:+ start:4838 stop:6151 length:1314 start_codon:yes stop_codon:yes gene_type:complete
MRIVIILSFVLFSELVSAQEYKLDKVLELALANNHNIKVFQNNVIIADNIADPGNAGLLPQFSLNGGVNYSSNDTKLELLAQPKPVAIEQAGAESISANLGLGLNWVIFDGMAMFRNYDKLKILIDLEDVKTRASVENTLMLVISNYYQMASAINNVKISSQSIAITNDRLRRAKAKHEVGASSSIDYLSAQVDLNTDSVTLINSKAQLEKAANNLNQLTGYQLSDGFTISGDVDIETRMVYQELVKQANSNNAQLLNAEYSRLAAEKNMKITESGYAPIIALSGSYGLNYVENEIGNLLSNRSLGYSAGVTLSYPIFQANIRKIKAQNAKVALLSSEEIRLNTIDQLKTDMNNAWIDYERNLAVLEMEKRNLKNAEVNFTRSRELYQLGNVTNVQFRAAQLNYLRTQVNIINSKYQVRLSEFELIRLSGMLIQKGN